MARLHACVYWTLLLFRRHLLKCFEDSGLDSSRDGTNSLWGLAGKVKITRLVVSKKACRCALDVMLQPCFCPVSPDDLLAYYVVDDLDSRVGPAVFDARKRFVMADDGVVIDLGIDNIRELDA